MSSLPVSSDTFTPDYVVPPGAILEEWLSEQSVSRADFADAVGMEEQLDDLIRGALPLTDEMVERLAAATQIPARTWSQLEALYDGDVARLRAPRA